MHRILPLFAVLCLAFAPAPFPKPRSEASSVAADLEAMQGTWRRLSAERWGARPTFKVLNDLVTIKGDQITYGADKLYATTWTLTLGEGKPARAFDLELAHSTTYLGRYQLKGDTLRVCSSASGVRPDSLCPCGESETLDLLVRIKR